VAGALGDRGLAAERLVARLLLCGAFGASDGARGGVEDTLVSVTAARTSIW
jgi:hypothetical protein